MKRAMLKGKPKALPVALLEARTVAIKDLVRDPRFQVRGRVDDEIINRYLNVLMGGITMPPIRVALVQGALVVVDGWHRLAAHERCGLTHVEAEVLEATASEAQWMAAYANLSHGLPLKRTEIRKALGP